MKRIFKIVLFSLPVILNSSFATESDKYVEVNRTESITYTSKYYDGETTGARTFDSPWEYIGEKKCEGGHFELGGQTHMRINTTTNGPGKLITDQQEIKKDDGAGWEFLHHSDQHVEWHLWANNGIFSAPEVILKIMYRTEKIGS